MCPKKDRVHGKGVGLTGRDEGKKEFKKEEAGRELLSLLNTKIVLVP